MKESKSIPNSENPLIWLNFADMDLQTAKYLLQMRPLPLEIICYHCQQAGEKYVKAFIVAQGVIPPKIHDIEKLCKQCTETEKRFDEIRNECIFLTPYATIQRYPNENDLSEFYVNKAISAAETICNFEPLQKLREAVAQ